MAIQVEGLGKQFVVNELRHVSSLSDRIGRMLSFRLRSKPAGARENPVPETIWAIHDVSFALKKGRVLGVIGRNGSGKSTLLKIIARISSPSVGTIKLNGRVGALLEVGTGFHPDLSGRENILLNGAILGMTPNQIEAREASIIDFAELSQFIDTPIKHYSSGMFMRLAFSVAAHLEAEIMLVDEVLAVGDADFQEKCKAKIQDIAKSGRTILFTSHDMAAIRRVCDDVIVLEKGRLIHFGNVDLAIRLYEGKAADATVKA
ncbi:MAG: ABC transporter ATP-binding protein [Burkholderiales bacterium]